MRANQLIEEIFEIITECPKGVDSTEVAEHFETSVQQLGDAFEAIKSSGKVVSVGGHWFLNESFEVFQQEFVTKVNQLHSENPKELGFDPELMQKSLGYWLTRRALRRAGAELQRLGLIRVTSKGWLPPQAIIEVPRNAGKTLDRIVHELQEFQFAPPTVKQMSQLLHIPPQAVEAAYQIGADCGILVLLAPGIAITKESFQKAIEQLPPKFDLAQMRESLDTSREFTGALADFLVNTGRATLNGERYTLTQN